MLPLDHFDLVHKDGLMIDCLWFVRVVCLIFGVSVRLVFVVPSFQFIYNDRLNQPINFVLSRRFVTA